MEDFHKRVHRSALKALITHEVTLLRRMRDKTSSRMQRYFNSSSTRYNFAKIMVHAAMTDNEYSISQISELLAVSRVATIAMVNDTEAEGWVCTRPGSRKSKLCRACTELVTLAESWFDMHRQSIRDSGCDSHFRLLENLEQAIADQNRLKNRISV